MSFSDNHMVIFGSFALLIIGIVGAEILRQQVKKFYQERADKKKRDMEEKDRISTKIDELSKIVTDFIHEQKTQREYFTKEFEMHEENNRVSIENLQKSLEWKIQLQHNALLNLTHAEKEHYNELKGKIEAQWKTIGSMKTEIKTLQTTHHMCHFNREKQ